MEWRSALDIGRQANIDASICFYGKYASLGNPMVTGKLHRLLSRGCPRYNFAMSANPATLHWTATDGTVLHLRPIHTGDAQRVHRSLALLSREARRQRFLGTVSAFSDDFVNGLTAGDPARQYAVLVVRTEDGEEMPVAGGRLVLDAPPDGKSCEFSLIVGDRWQGQGIGQRILYALIAEARRRRLHTMVGHILRDNRPMLVLARHTGFIIEAEPGGDTLRATLDLDALVVTQALADRRFSAMPAAQTRAKRSSRAGQAGEEAAPLRAALLCAALAMAGLLLAMASVYLGIGWLDGFGDWDLHRLGRRFRRALLWALPLAAIAGLLLYACYRSALDEKHKGLIVLFAVIRAFAFFPLFGMAMLLGMIGGFAGALLLAAYGKLSGQPPAEPETDGLIQRLLVVPLWFLTLPFTLLKVQSQGDIDIPARVGKARLLNWLPFLIVLLALFTGGESEGSGQRIDPYWLTAIAAWWLGDYLVVAGWLAPTLAARARR